MDRQESAVAIVLALGGIKDTLEMDRVPVEVLWAAVQHRMSASDYAKVISGLCDGDYAIVEDDKIELTQRGMKFAEEIHERLKRGNKDGQDQPFDPKGAVGATGRGGEEGGSHPGSDAPSDLAREVQGDPPDVLTQRLVFGALADRLASMGSGPIAARHMLKFILFRTEDEEIREGWENAHAFSALLWARKEGLISRSGSDSEFLGKGLRMASIVLTERVRVNNGLYTFFTSSE